MADLSTINNNDWLVTVMQYSNRIGYINDAITTHADVRKAQNSAIAAQNDAICIGYHKKQRKIKV